MFRRSKLIAVISMILANVSVIYFYSRQPTSIMQPLSVYLIQFYILYILSYRRYHHFVRSCLDKKQADYLLTHVPFVALFLALVPAMLTFAVLMSLAVPANMTVNDKVVATIDFGQNFNVRSVLISAGLFLVYSYIMHRLTVAYFNGASKKDQQNLVNQENKYLFSQLLRVVPVFVGLLFGTWLVYASHDVWGFSLIVIINALLSTFVFDRINQDRWRTITS